MNASRLMDQIRADLADIEAAIRDHPFPEAVRTGAAGEAELRAFVGHQYHIVGSDLRSIAHLVERFGDTVARDFLIGVLEGERAAHDRVVTLGRALGVERDDLERYEVAAGGFAYAAYMAWIARYGSAAEFAAGLLVNFPAWGHNCGRLSAALAERHGLGPDDTAFLDGFANMLPFDNAALAIVQEGLDRGVDPAAVRRAARLFQAYELLFWNAVAGEGVEPAVG